MSFSRTASGLSNVAKFYGVDCIVYAEGRTQVCDTDPGSLDLVFWTRIFDRYAPTLNVRVVCRGSKDELLQIASQVASGIVSNVAVALDRDYDPELGRMVNHSAVVYTYGYSWENDVWNLDTILSLVEQNSLIQPMPRTERDLVVSSYNYFCTQARRVGRVNLAAALSGLEYVVPRSEHRALVKVSAKTPPQFCRKFFRSRLSTWPQRRVHNVTVDGTQVDVTQHCLGHMLAYFGCQLVCVALRRLGHRAKVDFELLSSMAINIFEKRLGCVTTPQSTHYESCVGSIEVT